MVKGHSLEDEKKRIDELFEKLSISDFDRMAAEAGASKIKNSCDSSYVKASQLRIDATYSNKTVYSSKSWDSKFNTYHDLFKGAA